MSEKNKEEVSEVEQFCRQVEQDHREGNQALSLLKGKGAVTG